LLLFPSHLHTVQAERRDMERQFEAAKFDLARKLLVEKVRRTQCR
jgi:hypothetical protein